MATNVNRKKGKNHSDSNSSEESDVDSTENETLRGNMFVNDGSFMEMFKKRMEAMQSSQQNEPIKQEEAIPAIMAATAMTSSSTSSIESVQSTTTTSNDCKQSIDEEQPKKSSMLSFVGKRRGGKVLPTGIVKKTKQDEEQLQNEGRTDAWSQYMAEVRKYKERSCEDEGKTRPLVK